MSTTCHPLSDQAESAAVQMHRLALPLAVAGALMLFTFSIVDEAPGGETLDGLVSKLKYGIRFLSIPVLLAVCLKRCRDANSLCGLGAYIPLFCFAGWALLSVVWSPLKSMSFGQAISLLALCLLSCSVAVSCHSARDTEIVLRSVCFSLLALSAGMLTFKFLIPSLAIAERDGTGLFHALNTAATASLGLILPLTCIAFWKSDWAGKLLIPAFPIHGLMLYLSASRLAAAITVVFVICLIARSLPPLYAIAVTFCVCVFGSFFLAVDPGYSTLSTANDAVSDYAHRGQSAGELSALSGREEMWQVMWESYLDSPYLGHGYFVSSNTGLIEVWHEEGNFTAHNMWLQVMVSTGLIGLCLFLWSMLQLLGIGVVRNSLSLTNRPIAKLLCVLAAWHVCWGLMNESLMGPLQPECVVFFVLTGMAIGRSHELSRLSHSHASTRAVMEAC